MLIYPYTKEKTVPVPRRGEIMRDETKMDVYMSGVTGAEYDAGMKQLMSNKEIIVPILQMTVSEFKTCSGKSPFTGKRITMRPTEFPVGSRRKFVGHDAECNSLVALPVYRGGKQSEAFTRIHFQQSWSRRIAVGHKLAFV